MASSNLPSCIRWRAEAKSAVGSPELTGARGCSSLTPAWGVAVGFWAQSALALKRQKEKAAGRSVLRNGTFFRFAMRLGILRERSSCKDITSAPDAKCHRLEHKKRGAREGSPFFWGGGLGLKSYAHAELQLAHANGGTGSGIGLDVRNLARACAAAAIHAGVARDGENRMVE